MSPHDSARRPTYWLVIAMIMGVLSILSYLWLLCQLRRRLAPGVRARLFPRQLQSLAVAGLMFNVFLLPSLYIDLWTFPSNLDPAKQRKYSDGCKYAYGVFRTARFLSVLQELHIALTFLAQSMRCVRALPALNRAIPVVWLGGLTLGVISYMQSVWSFDLAQNTCVEDKTDVVSVFSISFCAAMSVLSFFCTLQRSASSYEPSSVRRKNFKRAAAYPAVTIISYSGVLGAYMYPTLFEIPIWYWPVASILQASNGVLNTLTFYSQSKYASNAGTQPMAPSQQTVESSQWETRPWGQPEQMAQETAQGSEVRESRESGSNYASWHVDFGGVDVIDFMTLTSTQPSLVSTDSGGRTWRQLLHLPWDHDERADAAEAHVDAWTVQDLIGLSLQERTQLAAQTREEAAGSDPLLSCGFSLQPVSPTPSPETHGAHALTCAEEIGPEEASRITDLYFEKLSDDEAVGTAREFDLSRPGGRRRAKSRDLASAQAQLSTESSLEPTKPEHIPISTMQSCVSLPSPDQLEYCD